MSIIVREGRKRSDGEQEGGQAGGMMREEEKRGDIDIARMVLNDKVSNNCL